MASVRRSCAFGIGIVDFIVDTGCVGSLRTEFPRLPTSARTCKDLEIARQTIALQTAEEAAPVASVGPPNYRLGDWELANPVFQEGQLDLLGTGVLSRFRVTFDFPNDKMYPANGQTMLSRPETWDPSGLHLLRKDAARTVVDSVDKEAPPRPQA